MSGPLGFGAGGGGGDAVREVIAGSGITTSGTATSITVVNDGVRSLSGSGISVSSATGAVTITAPTVSGGTGISVSGSGTTSLTVSATGVQSLTAGTGISVSGTTTPTVTNSGVTSIVAGTNVTVSGATGAVTVNAPGFATPGSSAIGDTATAGTATTVSRSDHKHGREASGTPGASAVGDTAAAGTATTVALSDHRHSREAFGTPVNIDASLTSLSAGSLTTVARADHVHTVSNVPVLIANARMTTATASYTFSNIPSTFRHLCISVVGRSTWTGGNPDYVLVQFNGDSGANYYSSTSVGQTSCFIGVMNSATAGTPTMPSSDNIIIPNYSQTTWNKLVYTMEGWYNNSTTGTPNLSLWFNCTFWNSSAIITSVKVFCNAGNMATNTDLRLFGVP